MFRRVNKTTFTAAKSAYRTFAEEVPHAKETASQALMKRVEIPVWGMVSAGIAAAGFFGKMLHDDNLASRIELRESVGALRVELHNSVKDLKEDHKELRAEHKELRAEHKELRAEVRILDRKVTDGFQKLSAEIAELKKQGEPPRRGWF